jgi:hypothetical protein
MGSVHYRRRLIHTAVVQRGTASQSSTGELTDTWSAVGTYWCRFVEKSERIANESVGFQMLEEPLCLFDDDVDVQEEDRVVNVTLRATGAVVDAGPFTIEQLLNRNNTALHHVSAKLERIE